MRRRAARRAVLVVSAITVLACVVWAIVVQQLVPDACSYSPPPANAQYLHCH